MVAMENKEQPRGCSMTTDLEKDTVLRTTRARRWSSDQERLLFLKND